VQLTSPMIRRRRSVVHTASGVLVSHEMATMRLACCSAPLAGPEGAPKGFADFRPVPPVEKQVLVTSSRSERIATARTVRTRN
jgi:hypothetical protein